MSLIPKISNLKEKIIIIIMIISVLVGIYLALSSCLDMQDNEWKNNREEQCIIQTEKLATDADRQFFITQKILPLLKLICEDPKIDIKAIQSRFIEKYDLDISIYKFVNKNMVETAPEQAANKWLMRNLYPALIETDIPKIEAKRAELDKKIEFTFGYGKNLISIKNNPEIIINTVIAGEEAFAAWSSRGDKGVIILSNKLPDNNKVLKEIIEKSPKIIDQTNSGRLTENDNSTEQITAKAAYRHLIANSLEHGIYENKNWYFTTTKNNERYYTAYNLRDSVYYKSIIFLRIFFLILVVLIIVVVLNYSSSSMLSLKKFVTLIFIASSILPLTITGTTSLESIDTLTKIHKNELRSSMEEAIGNIIQNFGTYLNNCSTKLSELTEPPKNGFTGKESFEKMTQNIVKAFPEARVSIRNAASVQIYSNSTNYSSGQETLFKSTSNRYIEKYMHSRFNELPYSSNPFADMIVRKEDLGFSQICAYPNKLQYVKNAGSPLFFFIRVYPKSAGEAAVISVEPKLIHVLKKYTQNIDQRSLVSKQQIINLTAFNPLKYRWSIPPTNSYNQLFEQAKAAYVINKPIFRKILKNGKQIYALCIPNSNYEDICYTGSLSTDDFQKEINKLKNYIFIGAIVALILLVFIISWLMKQLISPLGNLEIGIKALSEHKFEIKLPVPEGKDELVTLFKEFNFMMGENYDMQMAKNVQEGLLTTKFPETSGYYINGFSIPAGDLGGDCLTSFSMPDGKILFLVGDLTGHGIGSALMMSFVRSVTFNWSQNPENNPASLADSIDQMLRDNHMEKMFMGIVCGILDPETGFINFITRGHIYPLFLRNDDTSEWLGSPALPLGIGKKHLSKEQSTTILPGERILCISDGMIEIHKDNGLTIDYKQIEEWAKQMIPGDNSSWLNRIENKYREWCKTNNAQQTDDITLFTIINEKSMEAN
ncbi:MAG: SpoIIE family protein phosphatase [Candidatus Riflebacteria bacterium]|nr:SpoIIE family protein phosphatase [Candidatus Riflebacteria bacterium]